MIVGTSALGGVLPDHPGVLVDHARELAGIGLDHVLISFASGWDDTTLEAVASVLPEMHAIPPAP